jgi:antitoxin (DNA-binding transcriptional repressor) of toxin-antitoxin stability system
MHYSMTEARARWFELARRAEAGEEVILTRYGRPVASLRQMRSVAPSMPTGSQAPAPD